MLIINLQQVHGFELSIGNVDHSTLLGDGLSADGPEVLAIDPAMEHFLSEYLQGDWGWDPFSGSVSTWHLREHRLCYLD